MKTYRVIGKQLFMGYSPGQVFVGALGPTEARAVKRGSIEVVDGDVPALDTTRVTSPRGWHQNLKGA